MARKRMLDSEIWRDKKVVKLSNDAFILWIAAISIADDEGILEYDPLAWYYEIARSSMTVKKIEAAMQEITRLFMIILYGDGYGFIPSWYKHQNLSHATKSKNPRPPKDIVEQYPEYIASWVKTFTTYRKNDKNEREIIVPEYPFSDAIQSNADIFRKTPEDSRNIRNIPGSIVEVSLDQVSLDQVSFDQVSLDQVSLVEGNSRVENPDNLPASLRIQESLISPIRQSFQHFNPQGFTEPKLEDPAIVGLSEKFCRLGRDTPGDFARAVLEKFHELTTGSDKFWHGQPFTPSNLNNPKIFDRVIAEMKTEEVNDGWPPEETRESTV